MVKSIFLKHIGNQNLYCSIPCRSPPPPRGNISSSPPISPGLLHSGTAHFHIPVRTLEHSQFGMVSTSCISHLHSCHSTHSPAPSFSSNPIFRNPTPFYFLHRAFFCSLKRPVSSLSRVLTSCLTPRLTEELI